MDIGIASAEATAIRGTRGTEQLWNKPRTRRGWMECTPVRPYVSYSERWKTDGRGAALVHRNTDEVVVQNVHVHRCHNASILA